MSRTPDLIEDGGSPRVHTVSVVVPVYQGERTLPALVERIEAVAAVGRTPDGHRFVITEVLLVHDCGPDRSDRTIRELVATHETVQAVWLSRNFGQHPATLAGMASSGGDWIVTMDEDGQHDPADIPRFLDVAIAEGASVVYGEPVNPPPHGALRNAASRGAKWLFTRLSTGGQAVEFQSYRLVLGETGRSMAAYAGAGVYLDVALSWVTGRTASCPVRLAAVEARPSGYSLRRLLSHFWRMVVTSGTKGLRIVSVLGLAFAVLGLLLAVVVVVARLTEAVTVQGWTSVMVVVLVGTGLVLFALGVIAEYVGVAVSMALGRPPYLIVRDPLDGPLGPAARRPAEETPRTRAGTR